MKRYVLTGTPGRGKTAILCQLEANGFSVVEEAASDLIALWQMRGITEPWLHPGFLDAVLVFRATAPGACLHRAARPLLGHAVS